MLLRPESIAPENDSPDMLEPAEPTGAACCAACTGTGANCADVGDTDVPVISAAPAVPADDCVLRLRPTERMNADEGLRKPNCTTSTSFRFWFVINSTVESKTGDVKSSVIRCGAWMRNEDDLLWDAGWKPRHDAERGSAPGVGAPHWLRLDGAGIEISDECAGSNADDRRNGAHPARARAATGLFGDQLFDSRLFAGAAPSCCHHASRCTG